jgi:hypothetical protein
MFADWKKFHTIVIDHTNISADMLDYPLYLNISATSGIGDVDITSIFDEVGANGLKIAVLLTDGKTECYLEEVSWDSVGETVEIWCRVPAVSTAADTLVVICYSLAHADNSSYVGVVGSTPGKAVWDANFVLVYHMNDTTTSTITGSTALNAAGVKLGANAPVEATGGVGKTQDFDGTDDKVTIADSTSLSALGTMTLESYFNQDVQGQEGLIGKFTDADQYTEWFFILDASGRIRIFLTTDGIPQYLDAVGTTEVSDTTYHYGVGTWDGVNLAGHTLIYVDGNLDALTTDVKQSGGYIPHDSDMVVTIGQIYNDTLCFDGKISETRISNIARSAAYVKANQYCFTDALVTFWAERPKPNLLNGQPAPFVTALLNGNI